MPNAKSVQQNSYGEVEALLYPLLSSRLPFSPTSGSVRTLQRWVAQYRKAGLVGLARKLRRDRGERRAVSPKYWMVRDIVRKLPRDLLILAHRGAKAYGESFDLVIDGKLRRQRHLAGRPCSTRHSASEGGWLRWYTLANDHHR